MLRGNNDFRLLFAGQLVSVVAGGSAMFALPLLVYLRTDSAVQAGLVGTVSLTAYVFAMLPTGTMADRWPTRTVLVAAELTRAVAALALTVAIIVDRLPLWLVLAYAAVESGLATLFRASGTCALKRIVPGKDLATALSWILGRNAVGGLVAPALGGLLLALHHAAPFAVKAVAHVTAVAAVLAIRTPLPVGGRLEGPVSRQLLGGLLFLWRDRFLRSALLIAGSINLVFGAVHSMVSLDSAEEGFEMEEIGLVVALAAAGGLIGSALAPKLSRHLTPRHAFILVLGGGAVIVPMMALASDPLTLALLFAACMILPPVVTVMVTTARILRTPDELQGRATTATTLVSMGMAPIGPVVSGVIVEYAEGGRGFLAYGAVLAGLAVIAILNRGLRTHDHPVVDRPAQREIQTTSA